MIQIGLKILIQKIKSEKAREELKKDLEKIPQTSEEEIEEKIFSIEGVEKGKDWEKAKEQLREKGKE
ncbi:hypothetical protein ES703_112324 [subsurface metagenome]